MQGLRVEEFTVDGKDSGTITMPCNSTSVRIVVALSGLLTRREEGEIVNVPIWIGEHHTFRPDTTLVKSFVRFKGSAGTRYTRRVSFTLWCSGSCELTPSGGPSPSVLKLPKWWLRPDTPQWISRLTYWVWWVFTRTVVWLLPWFPDGSFTEYRRDGPKMTLTLAYYDKSEVPLFRWYYRARTITVECVGTSATG